MNDDSEAGEAIGLLSSSNSENLIKVFQIILIKLLSLEFYIYIHIIKLDLKKFKAFFFKGTSYKFGNFLFSILFLF